jgi:hypothetical protein
MQDDNHNPKKLALDLCNLNVWQPQSIFPATLQAFMKTFSASKLVIWLFITGFAFTSCDIKQDPKVVTDAAVDEATARSEFNQMFSFVENRFQQESIIEKTASDALLPPCASANFEVLNQANDQYRLTIDFGTTDCLCYDNVKRRGKLIANISGKWRTAGNQFVLTAQDYFYDGVKVEGTRTTTNNGQNNSGNWTFTTQTQNGKLTFENGEVILWTTNAVSELTAGASTINPFDDTFSTTGTSNGTTRSGNNFTATVTEPLIANTACLLPQNGYVRHFSRGIIRFESQGNTLILNYDPNGTGGCNRQASVKFNNLDPINILLR